MDQYCSNFRAEIALCGPDGFFNWEAGRIPILNKSQKLKNLNQNKTVFIGETLYTFRSLTTNKQPIQKINDTAQIYAKNKWNQNLSKFARLYWLGILIFKSFYQQSYASIEAYHKSVSKCE